MVPSDGVVVEVVLAEPLPFGVERSGVGVVVCIGKIFGVSGSLRSLRKDSRCVSERVFKASDDIRAGCLGGMAGCVGEFSFTTIGAILTSFEEDAGLER